MLCTRSFHECCQILSNGTFSLLKITKPIARSSSGHLGNVWFNSSFRFTTSCLKNIYYQLLNDSDGSTVVPLTLSWTEPAVVPVGLLGSRSLGPGSFQKECKYPHTGIFIFEDCCLIIHGSSFPKKHPEFLWFFKRQGFKVFSNTNFLFLNRFRFLYWFSIYWICYIDSIFNIEY